MYSVIVFILSNGTTTGIWNFELLDDDLLPCQPKNAVGITTFALYGIVLVTEVSIIQE